MKANKTDLNQNFLRNHMGVFTQMFKDIQLSLKTVLLFFLQTNTENYYIVTHTQKLKHDITGILLTIKYVYEMSESSFTSRTYKDAEEGSQIAEIATAPIYIGGEERECTVIGNKDGTTYQFIT